MIALVDYGAGNLRSVEFALEHLGVPWRRADKPEDLADATAIILPGVGAAASAMRQLEEHGLDNALRESEVPLLGICLGMQLLTDRSEEGENEVECLGLVRADTRRFGAPRRDIGQGTVAPFPYPLPHIGWNETRLSGDPIFEGLDATEHFYFLHAYRVCTADENVIAEADYGETFPAAIRCGHRVAVQFHPEKSGPSGLRILANFCHVGRL
ncbi:MAG: imidazole glycerol phosphate synthase subunit HisH [Gemmatimonadota bacterium]